MTFQEEYQAALKANLTIEVEGKAYDLRYDLEDILEGNPYLEEDLLIEMKDGVSFWYVMGTDDQHDQYFLEFAA